MITPSYSVFAWAGAHIDFAYMQCVYPALVLASAQHLMTQLPQPFIL